MFSQSPVVELGSDPRFHYSKCELGFLARKRISRLLTGRVPGCNSMWAAARGARVRRDCDHQNENEAEAHDAFRLSLSKTFSWACKYMWAVIPEIIHDCGKQMRITELRVHSIAIADPPLRSSYGLHAPYALRTILELKTDSGLTGISETYGGDGPLAGLEAVRARVTGMDPFQLAGLWRDLSAEAGAGDRTQTY